MASPEEIALGRLAVERGLATEAQVLDALKERNQQSDGPDLGEVLVSRGLFSAYVLNELRRVARDGGATPRRSRHEMSTDSQFSLGGAREAIARECLNEARAKLDGAEREAALTELRRLSEEFDDTESGAEAGALWRKLGGS